MPFSAWLRIGAPLAFAGLLEAQGTVSGRIIDKSTRTPVLGAEVMTAVDGRKVIADSAGRFSLSGVPDGAVRLVIRAQGFSVSTFDVTMKPGATLEPIIQLDSTATGRSEAQPLPGVEVTTPASRGPRFVDFERRQRTGRGQYLTKEQISRMGMNSLGETLRTLRGVEVDCGGGAGCFVHMARAPMRCLPEWIVDERLDNFFGPRTPLQDIEAIEVYSGPSDVPGEFAGRNAGCGVIVIWTKSGPPRRRP
ncbi:MAG: TonB-dependent receptor [Gemmatimonadetes bacterium]|nr:TonB-dependent receptor [Gemmatimonadota bacterium]